MIITSAVICTYRRPQYLEGALQSLLDQTMPKDQYEIVLVDNDCDPKVQAMLERYASQAQVVYVAEPAIGISRARNTGLKSARGRYVAFLDDDALASPGWVQAVTDAFEAGGGKIGTLGGPVDLIWPSPRPDWLRDSQLAALGYINYGDTAHELDESEWLYCLNQAFFKPAMEEIGGFAAGLGREGNRKHLISNEEILPQIEFRKRGYSVYYSPTVKVTHTVQPERLTTEWFRRRYYWQGVSDSLMAMRLAPYGPLQRLRKALGVIRRMVTRRDLMTVLFRLALGRRDSRDMQLQCGVLRRLGQIVGWFRSLPSS